MENVKREVLCAWRVFLISVLIIAYAELWLLLMKADEVCVGQFFTESTIPLEDTRSKLFSYYLTPCLHYEFVNNNIEATTYKKLNCEISDSFPSFLYITRNF